MIKTQASSFESFFPSLNLLGKKIWRQLFILVVKECAKLSREKDVEKPTECCEAVPQAWLNNGFPQDCGEGMHCEMMASEEAPEMEMAVCMPDEEAAE